MDPPLGVLGCCCFRVVSGALPNPMAAGWDGPSQRKALASACHEAIWGKAGSGGATAFGVASLASLTSLTSLTSLPELV